MTEVNIKEIKLVIGLGNPGKKYEETYHNAGFLAVDFLLKNNFPDAPKELKFKVPRLKNFGYVETNGLIFIKPVVFMNNSGKAIEEALRYFSIKPEETLIVHDDSDIELGNLKVSFNRGSAGHKGVESIIRILKTQNFYRLRIGIGKNNPPVGISRKKAEDIVLKKINKKDMETIKEGLKTIKINQK